MNNTTSESGAQHRAQVGRAAAARVILESAAGDCHDREVILQAVFKDMAQCGPGGSNDDVVGVRCADGWFEPFQIDEFREEFRTCVEDDHAAVAAGAAAAVDEFLRGGAAVVRSTRIH